VNEVFADTFYFLALLNPADKAHELAVNTSVQLNPSLTTTVWVLAELADALSDAASREQCAHFIRTVLQNAGIYVSDENDLFAAGLALYEERLDKDWSLTDCISFVVMKRRNLVDAFTGDRHFEQAGFNALFRNA